MRKSRFTESQIVNILKELKAGSKAADVCRRHGVSEATLYNWRAKYQAFNNLWRPRAQSFDSCPHTLTSRDKVITKQGAPSPNSKL